MVSARIGVRSSGLSVFTGRVVSAFTGFLFNAMVARWLVPKQFGLWEVVIDLVAFASYPVTLVTFWATRDVARGKMLGRTALVTGGLLSMGGLAIYFAFTFVTYTALSAALLPFLLGAILVPLSYWSVVTGSVVAGYRPSVAAISLVVSEFCKLGAAYACLYVYHTGINGVLAALMVAYFVQSLVGTYLVRGAAGAAVERREIRRWLGLAWIPAISQLPIALGAADTFVASLGFGTGVAGIYQAAFVVASVVGYSVSLSASLYPLLLRGGAERLTGTIIEFSLLFSIPLAAGGLALAGPILYLFGPSYAPASLGLSILSVMFVFTTLSNIIDQTLLGTEKVDEMKGARSADFLTSNLLYVPAINLTSVVVYVVSMYLVLRYSFSAGLGTSSEVALWATVQLAATLAFMMVKARRARRYANLAPPSLSVVYYLVAAAVMGLVVYFASPVVAVESLGTLTYGIRLLALVFAGSAIYFGLVYALDGRFRDMAHSFMRRI